MSAIDGSSLMGAGATTANNQTFATKSVTDHSNAITTNMSGEINTNNGFQSEVLSSMGIGGQLDVSV
ncbi:MAG: hypothetical protein AB9872_15625 [Solidesulfovibrio sp.]